MKENDFHLVIWLALATILLCQHFKSGKEFRDYPVLKSFFVPKGYVSYNGKIYRDHKNYGFYKTGKPFRKP